MFEVRSCNGEAIKIEAALTSLEAARQKALSVFRANNSLQSVYIVRRGSIAAVLMWAVEFRRAYGKAFKDFQKEAA